jgi:hypothetical protein
MVLRAESITGLLMVDRHLEAAADQLTLAGLAVDGLKAAADQEQAIRAAQLLADGAHRLRMVAATVAAVQASLGRLTAEDDDDRVVEDDDTSRFALATVRRRDGLPFGRPPVPPGPAAAIESWASVVGPDWQNPEGDL